MTIILLDKISSLNNNFSIWRYSNRLRVTYVSQGWLVLWDHAQNPPERHDCKAPDHPAACRAVVQMIENLQTKKRIT